MVKIRWAAVKGKGTIIDEKLFHTKRIVQPMMDDQGTPRDSYTVCKVTLTIHKEDK